jgi:hypothetical protein
MASVSLRHREECVGCKSAHSACQVQVDSRSPIFTLSTPLHGQMAERTKTPFAALLTQAVIALCLVAFGQWQRKGFETLVEYTAPVFWFFFLLTGVSLIYCDEEIRTPQDRFVFHCILLLRFYSALPPLTCSGQAWPTLVWAHWLESQYCLSALWF